MSNNQGDILGVDKWIVIYPFGGTSSAPEINASPTGGGIDDWGNYDCADNACAGLIGTAVVETEICIPRSDLGLTTGLTVKVYSFGNKSAYDLKASPISLTF